MSFLVNLYKITSSKKDNKEDFITASLVELMNIDPAAQQAILEALGLSRLGRCYALAQHKLFSEDGVFIGKADIYLSPLKNNKGIVIEAKVQDKFKLEQVQKYTNAKLVEDVLFLARKLDDVDRMWTKKSHTWSHIHHALLELERTGEATPWSRSFIELLLHVHSKTGGMIGSANLKKLPKVRVTAAYALLEPASQHIKDAIEGSISKKHKGDEEIWKSDLLDWAWTVEDGSTTKGFSLNVELGPMPGVLNWTIWVCGAKCLSKKEWEEASDGWHFMTFALPMPKQSDFVEALATVMDRAHKILDETSYLKKTTKPNPRAPALLTCEDVEEGLRMVNSINMQLSAHITPWCLLLKEKLNKDGRLGQWTFAQGPDTEPRLIQEKKKWYIYISVAYPNGEPLWRLSIWRRHEKQIDKLSNSINLPPGWSMKKKKYRLKLSHTVTDQEPDVLSSPLLTSLFNALAQGISLD